MRVNLLDKRAMMYFWYFHILVSTSPDCSVSSLMMDIPESSLDSCLGLIIYYYMFFTKKMNSLIINCFQLFFT